MKLPNYVHIIILQAAYINPQQRTEDRKTPGNKDFFVVVVSHPVRFLSQVIWDEVPQKSAHKKAAK